MKYFFILIAIFILRTNSFSQISDKKIDEVVIESQRIDVPFSKKSHNVVIIKADEIEKSTATNVSDLLQQVAGIDVRRRGLEGMQSDLYIRGGSFDQVLILIDGIKTDDAQTGHHTMNNIIPLENIERIEIVKGPAARIYGQNAFTGAINIVTKQKVKSNLILQTGIGSYNTMNGEITGILDLKKFSFQAHYSRNHSKGYRFNTDFTNDNFFLKTAIKTNKSPINILGTFSQRKFGANGFYASPQFKDQYEETQTSLVGVSTKILIGKLSLKPKIYWRRNQDNYFFLRKKPSFYENFHISNKIGVALNAKYVSKIGALGLGAEIDRVFLASNNLGNRQRTTVNFFIEHKFDLLKGDLSITPGIAMSYYTDFKFHAFPGLDLGLKINEKFNLIGNIGYTYRIPTYTDLYYNSPTTLGNTDLLPETALAEELGIEFHDNNFSFTIVGFNRNANNLIDYTKENENEKYKAVNIRNVLTSGIELNTLYNFKLFKKSQNLNIGYTYLNDKIIGIEVPFSRYSLNSAKHQLTSSLDFSLLKNVNHFITFKYIERPDGSNYKIFDAKLSFIMKQVVFSAVVNNLFDAEYTETNLVPMPKRNFMFSLKYSIK